MAPSFFKFLRDPSASRLSLPPAFVREHLVNNISNGPIIISASGGDSWTLKIEKIGDLHYFTNGWENVVKDIPLDFADFLIFHLVDPSTFRMTIFGVNGCERILPRKEVDEDVANDFEDDDHHNDEDVADEVEDDDDNDEDDDDADYEEDEENEDGDPSFTSVITKTTKSMLRLPAEFVALAEIDAEGIMAMKNVDGEEWYTCLRVEKSHDTKRFYLTEWRDFQRENHICEGDECVFKFIRSEGKLLLVKVTKPSVKTPEVMKRTRGRPAKQPKPSVKTPEVVKRKRGRPAKQPKPSVQTPEVMKRKRGRPAKQPKPSVKNPEVVKRKRGRPAKMSQPTEPVKKKRGRPSVQTPEVMKRKRGRPAKQPKPSVKNPEVVKRKRGRPAKMSQPTEPVKKKRGRPAKQPQPSGEILVTEAAKAEKEKGAASKAAVVNVESDEENI